MGRSQLLVLGVLTVATCLTTTAPRAEDIVIYTGHAGYDPGYTQLAALYENTYPDVNVVISDDFSDVARERLTFISLIGYEDPSVVLQFEELLILAINWGLEHRLVVITDATPPYVATAANNFLGILQTGLGVGDAAHGATCGNLTTQIVAGHGVTMGIGELAYGQTNELSVAAPGIELVRTGDGQHVLIATAPALGTPGDPCGDVVLLADAELLADDCDALAHPGNRQLARNLYESCEPPVPVADGTWGAVKALYR
ncbi:MAG: hypothetical protein PVF43_05475 [Candidatus Eiseniibacteriota bacterium]|jgi:hypothetical protein